MRKTFESVDESKNLIDPYAESACLGALLSSAENALEVLSLTNEEDYNGENWKIIRVARDLYEAQDEISFVTLRDGLDRRGWLESIGGEAGLVRIGKRLAIDKGGTIRLGLESNMIFAGVAAAAKRVKEKANARRLTNSIDDVSNKLTALDINTYEACGILRDSILHIDVPLEHAAKKASDLFQSNLDHVHSLQVGKKIAEATGFGGFDSSTGGLRGGDVLLLVGLTKGGKSILALSIADNLVQRGIPMAYFSLEMPLEELDQRRVCRRLSAMDWTHTEFAGIKLPLAKIMGGFGVQINALEADLMRIGYEEISKEPLFEVPPTCRENRAILMEAERLITQCGVKGLIIDHMQLARGNGTEYQNLTYLSQEVKALCNAHADKGVFAIEVSQMTGTGQKVAKAFGRIDTEDAHGSGELQKSATVITNIWLEREKFECNCPKELQSQTKQVTLGGKVDTITTYKHESRPTTGMCADCRSYIKEIPVRTGGWYLDRARSSGAGLVIPIELEGRYMQITEIE
jgi:replicative DNA helicase